MATFYSLLSFMSVNGFEYSDANLFDIISNLPLEIAIIILRTLSGKDLLNVAQVNKRWFQICKGDSKLCQKIRRYLRQQRRVNIATRMFGTGPRNRLGNISSRPVMVNVENIVRPSSLNYVGTEFEIVTPRNMPYRRAAVCKPSKVISSTQRARHVIVTNTGRLRLRL